MKQNIHERFYGHVEKSSAADGCWIWRAALNEAGYGVFFVDDAIGVQLAHRFAFMMETKQVLPDDIVLDHLCRNRACVRPSHLDDVTQRLNTARGTSPAAENARKDACLRGHPFSVSNTYRTARGRQCRTCMRMANTRYAQLHPDRARQRMRRYRARSGPGLGG